MQYKLFTNQEVVDVKTPATAKNSINPKDVILAISGILLIVMIVLWYLSSREVEKLREEKIELTQKLIDEQEKETEVIRERAAISDRNIGTIEQRRIINRENEKTIIDNPVSLDVRAAEEFFAEYEPTTIDTTN